VVTERDRLRVVTEDLRYLIASWLPGEIPLDQLRRDSVVLRRLVGSDSGLLHAWTTTMGKNDFFVPTWRLEDVMAELPKKHTLLSSIGGAHFHEAELGPMVVGLGKIDLPLPEHLQPHAVPLNAFSNGNCLFVMGEYVSRVALVEYFANRLGGAHVGKPASGKVGAALDKVPRYTADGAQIRDTIAEGGLPLCFTEITHDGTVYQVDALHSEILAIGQGLAKSPSTSALLDQID